MSHSRKKNKKYAKRAGGLFFKPLHLRKFIIFTYSQIVTLILQTFLFPQLRPSGSKLEGKQFFGISPWCLFYKKFSV